MLRVQVPSSTLLTQVGTMLGVAMGANDLPQSLSKAAGKSQPLFGLRAHHFYHCHAAQLLG
jgi:hypothetical protein